MRYLQNPVYLNTNIIYSTIIQVRKGKFPLIQKLLTKYQLVTSPLTKREVLKQLVKKDSIPFKKAKLLYKQILDEFQIYEISPISKYIQLKRIFENLA